MHNSIRQIRHSATRKKVDKIFEKLDTGFSKHNPNSGSGSKHQRMRSSPEDEQVDSGFSSKMSTLRSEKDETDSAKPTQPRKKG